MYDLADTEPRSEEAEELLEKLPDPFAVEGELSEDAWMKTLQNCWEKERGAVRLTSNFHRRHGGRVEGRPFQSGSKNPDGCTHRVLINEDLRLEEQYGALAHELGHLFCGHFCGHLGADDGAWWDACASINEHQKEIEA
ncbi:ImmA/IrrE family metallo-endopeptidase [Salinibacter altiplanensis]|uniref:ImmA/IrrE family metallo-endopeptidase n=1 Tax=Salinibacter altiplanensis TaxID=1803181 RepID=UPI000C9F1329|nr:ImmA/IrrE family metallo-endopeptidase [Salinibacter altiplanensis]